MSSPTPPEPTDPHPPMLPWLRRIGEAFGAMLLLLLVVRLAWGWYAQYTLDAMLADLQARGYPINETQLVASVPPSVDDAAPLLRRAAAAVGRGGPYVQLPIAAADATAIDALCASFDHPLELLHQAANCKAARWDIRLDPKTPGYFRDTRTLERVQRLAWLVHDATLLAHQRHQDDRAIGQLSDGFRMANLTYGTRSLIGHLKAIAIESNMSQTALQLASDLEIAGHGTGAEGSASRGVVAALITALGDEESLQRGMMQSWNGERLATLVFIDAKRWTWLYRPLGQLNIVGILRAIDIQQPASAAKTWPAAYEKLRPVELRDEQESESNLLRLTYSCTAESAIAVRLHFRTMADRRAARILLAMRLFQIGHGGRLPANLSDLCPDYLPEIPADPFSKDSRPFGYVDDGRNPRIYSVGQTGSDDGGTIHTYADGTVRRWTDQGAAVFLYYRELKAEPRPAAPGTHSLPGKGPQQK